MATPGVRVEIFQPKTDLFAQKVVRKRVERLVDVVARNARRDLLRYTGNSWPTPTGELSRSIRVNISRRGRKVIIGSVGSNHSKAMLVHSGAKPHVIQAVNAGGMKFYWKAKGRFVCIKAPVFHPGMNGKFFLSEPLRVHGPGLGFRVITSVEIDRFER